MGNNICTDGVPFTVSDLHYTPEAGNIHNSLLSGDGLISADVVQSFQGFDHNFKALRMFYQDPPRSAKSGDRMHCGSGNDRRDKSRSCNASTTGAHGAATGDDFPRFSPSSEAAAEHVGVEPVHLSAGHVPVYMDNVYLLIHVQRSTSSAPPTSRGPSPRENCDVLRRAPIPAGLREDTSYDSLNAPTWARAMTAVFTPRGMATPFARSTPRPGFPSTPRLSARRHYTPSEHPLAMAPANNVSNSAAGQGHPDLSPQQCPSGPHQLPFPSQPQVQQQQSPPPWHVRLGASAGADPNTAGAYNYYLSLHLLTGGDAHPLVSALAVLHALRLDRQLKEHPEQLKYLFYNVNRSRLVSGERGGSRTSRRERAILTVTNPCLIGRFAWPAAIGNPNTLPTQRLNEACRRNAVLRCLHNVGFLSGRVSFSPRAVSASGTSVSSTSASPRSAGCVLGSVGTTRGTTVPSAAFVNRTAATATSTNHNSGGPAHLHPPQGAAQQGPPTFSITSTTTAAGTTSPGHEAQSGRCRDPGCGRRHLPDSGYDAAVPASTAPPTESDGVSRHQTGTATPSSQRGSGEPQPRDGTRHGNRSHHPTSAHDEEVDDDDDDLTVQSTSSAPAYTRARTPTMVYATATPSVASNSSPRPALPNLNLSKALSAVNSQRDVTRKDDLGSTKGDAAAAPSASVIPNLGLSRLRGLSTPLPPQSGPVRGSAALSAFPSQRPPTADERDDSDADATRDDNSEEADNNNDDTRFDETDERRMSEDRVNRLRQVAPYATQVLPWLFVGGETAAKDKVQLLQKGITAVVNTVAFNVPNHFQDCFRYLSLNLQDTPDEPIFSLIPYVNAFIEDARLNGGKVFIHCHQGVSRSCSFAIGYIMWNNGLCYDAAYELVRSRRLVCSPNSGFYVNLRCWEAQLARPQFNNGFAFVPHSKSFLSPFSFRQVFTFCPVGTGAASDGPEADRYDASHFQVVHPLLRVITNSSEEASRSVTGQGPARIPSQKTAAGAAPVIAGGHAKYVLDSRLCYGFLLYEKADAPQPPQKGSRHTRGAGQLRSYFWVGSACPAIIAEAAQMQWEHFVHFSYFRGYVPLSSSVSANTPGPGESEPRTPTPATIDASLSPSNSLRPLTPVPMIADGFTSVDQHGQSITYYPVPEVEPVVVSSDMATPTAHASVTTELIRSPRTLDRLVQSCVAAASFAPKRAGGRPPTPRSGIAAGGPRTGAGWPHCVLGTDDFCGGLIDAHGGIDAVSGLFEDHLKTLSVDAQALSSRQHPSMPKRTGTRTLAAAQSPSSDNSVFTQGHLAVRPSTAPGNINAAAMAAETPLSMGSNNQARPGRLGGGGGASTPRAGGGGGGGPSATHNKRRRASASLSATSMQVDVESAAGATALPMRSVVPSVPGTSTIGTGGDVHPQTPPTANRAFHRSAGAAAHRADDEGIDPPHRQPWATPSAPFRVALPASVGSAGAANGQELAPGNRYDLHGTSGSRSGRRVGNESNASAQMDAAARRSEAASPVFSQTDTRPGSKATLGSDPSDEEGVASAAVEASTRLADVEVYPYPFNVNAPDHDAVYIDDLDPEECYAIAVPGMGTELIRVFIWFGEGCALDRKAAYQNFLDAFAARGTVDLARPTLVLSGGRYYPNASIELVESANEPDELLTAM